MLLWPWDDWVRPIRTLFSRRRRSRWKEKWDKGVCCYCKLPFDSGKKRRVVDSCGHHRCYACLCAQDACPVCSREVVVYKSLQNSQRVREKNENDKRNSKRFSQISNISVEFSFDATFPSSAANNITLKPLYFEVPQTDEVSSFLYRDWIFQEISKVIGMSNLKGILLVGDEGCGKTSLILQLVDWSSFGRKRKSGILNDVALSSLEMFERLASQVVGYHFCQMDCRETCLIPDFIHSLAAQLCQAPQLPEYRNFLLQDESCQQLLSLEACIEDPDKAFQKGILEPLINLSKYPASPSILVIDSVHESESPSRSICSFLATYINRFPSWLKVVMSVNIDNVNMVTLLPLHRINLDCAMAKVRDDLLRYIKCRINSGSALQANISACRDEKQISRFAEHLASGENATFLFVKLVLDLLQQNHLVIKSSSFNVIPVSLDEIFTLMFSLRFPTSATFSKVKPILEICLASLRPLTAVEIFYSLEAASVIPSFSWSDFTQTLRTLSGILIQRKDESLMLSHPSLRRWLLKTNKFSCDVRNGHSYLTVLPARLRYPITPEKQSEVIYHLCRSNLFEKEEGLKALLLHHSLDTPTVLIKAPRILFWTDEEIIRLLMKAGANPNSQMDTLKRQPILNLACKIGFLEIVRLLLEFGADPNSSDDFGKTPAMEAADHGHLKIVQILLSSGAKIHEQDEIGRCVLSYAAEKGHPHIVALLMESKSWPSPFLRSQAIHRALVAAYGNRNLQMCEYLIKVSDDFEKLFQGFKMACSLGQKAVCQFFLDNTITGHDILLQAAARGDLPMLQTLADKGCSLDIKDKNGRTALMWACIYRKIDAVRFLIEKGANLKSKDPCTPLHMAAIHADENIITLLLTKGADSEVRNRENLTPLECAISARNVSTTLGLLKGGVTIGSDAFKYAQGHLKIYSLLLDKLLSDGVLLYEKGNFTEASHRFQFALGKACFGENLELIRNHLQEGLHRCKLKMSMKNEGLENDGQKLIKPMMGAALMDTTNINSVPYCK
ncbi:protein TANC2-like isoform X2 [Argiope bruennichi]|uniref:Protein TANC2 like protein n=1 Tax=Argiope bruennichi TaxID=94029 RepID=A0A8T0FGK9_ARGBR|nr:protein TANC2-like isoform X2 [Argiope bruennichi]KAF8790424.1 Protein TANC2 like protein [Argiope bruennichi]